MPGMGHPRFFIPLTIRHERKVLRMSGPEPFDQIQIGKTVPERNGTDRITLTEKVQIFPREIAHIFIFFIPSGFMTAVIFSYDQVRTIHNVDICGQFQCFFPGNKCSHLSGKIEPDSGKPFQKVINGGKRSPFHPHPPTVFPGIGIGIIISQKEDPFSLPFDVKPFGGEFFYIQTGGSCKGMIPQDQSKGSGGRFCDN